MARRSWPHAPQRVAGAPGAHIVTAGTYQKEHLFQGDDRMDLLQGTLFDVCEEFRWQLQAWAVFGNHYHFVGIAPESGPELTKMIGKLHACTSRELNKLDGTPGRKVWHQFWDTHLTFERSYLARLAYVHHNPVKHGVVSKASEYPWCSARWFEEHADRASYETVSRFKTDAVNVIDDF